MTAHHHHFYLLCHFFSFLVKIWNNYNKTNKLDQKRWKINRYYSHFYQIMTTTRSLISSIQWLPQQQIINHHMSLITLQMYWMVCECSNQPRWTSSALIPIWQKKNGSRSFSNVCALPQNCCDAPLDALIRLFWGALQRGRSSRCSIKKGVLRNFAIFGAKHLCWSLFFIKKGSNTGVFLWILRNFWEHLFLRTSGNDYFWYYSVRHPIN